MRRTLTRMGVSVLALLWAGTIGCQSGERTTSVAASNQQPAEPVGKIASAEPISNEPVTPAEPQTDTDIDIDTDIDPSCGCRRTS